MIHSTHADRLPPPASAWRSAWRCCHNMYIMQFAATADDNGASRWLASGREPLRSAHRRSTSGSEEAPRIREASSSHEMPPGTTVQVSQWCTSAGSSCSNALAEAHGVGASARASRARARAIRRERLGAGQRQLHGCPRVQAMQTAP
eukprot:CAMPEP_0179182638 /NCGR_PEP_ID=MMETSP0796-20121207/90499_1 /TAXON_ID=73915 /ORGANISM="Pyrodinium bahamense, Strain pbaha01" /LENGTH=146 /DNA_ID=CAMNT_0020886487 /DNA_START=19 /DNA_END=455 /DNA_ORIENTATION=+